MDLNQWFPGKKLSSLIDDTLCQFGDGELFVESSHTSRLFLNDGLIKNASAGKTEGFGLRALAGEAAFYAHSSDISLPQIQQAARHLSTFPKPGSQSLDGPMRKPLSPSLPVSENVTFPMQVKLIQEIDRFARDLDKRVCQVSVSLSESAQNILILRLGGYHVTDVRPYVHLAVQMTLEHKGRREQGAIRMGGQHSLNLFLDPTCWQDYVREAYRRACVALEAVPMVAGTMPVILGPGSPGVLLHEAVGHGLEGDFNRKGHSVFSQKLGQRVAARGVTVIDDGRRTNGLENSHGSQTIDDEGTPTQSTVLIDDGILVGHMCDRLNGRLLGRQSTGNGRRESYASMPFPRMTNTYMKPGNAQVEDMIADVKQGIYAVSFGGGQVDIVSGNFVFDASEAYRVENGKIQEPIKEVTLIGNGPEVMQKIQMIGADFEMGAGLGYCGKNGQNVIVGFGQPSLLISELTVGGTG